jgi:two-component system response regulator YesN
MDINIPLLSGLDAIETIRAQLPGTIFVIISGYDDFAFAQKAIHFGVSEYLLKPVSFDDLALVLERIRRQLLRQWQMPQRTPQSQASATEEPVESKRVYQIITWLHEHLTEDITLKALSGIFYLHPTYISQLFKRETGMNYHDYLMRLRIDAAKKLLSTTDMSISQIADLTGFQDYRRFSQVFKRLENVTPSKLKASHPHFEGREI